MVGLCHSEGMRIWPMNFYTQKRTQPIFNDILWSLMIFNDIYIMIVNDS
jgi:hypothetical protein